MAVQSTRDPAPLDPRELEATLRPFGESRMLPRAAYVDEAVFAWEQANFFEGGWLCVGRSEQVAEPGDQRLVALHPHVEVVLERFREAILQRQGPHRGRIGLRESRRHEAGQKVLT